MSARFAMRTCERCDHQVLATADGRCPHCDMRLVEPEAPQVLRVTLSPGTTQPHVCLQCGEPTHRQGRVRAVGPRPPAVPSDAERHWLWVLLALPFGPFAWFLEWLDGRFAAVSARRRPAMSLRIRQCPECAKAGRPSGYAPDYDIRRMSFDAHPRYLEALARLNRDARQDARLKTTPSRGDDDARPISPS